MPYRTELRRPDLKGQFRCSLCSKIFCHSSSLSRHRMQAHFKSYTCTLCNKEITSNETLRAHMYKKHQISRMFMCRCCNWAFPDKTSLHIHMQAMATGNPGNVSIIAKSSSSPPLPGDGGGVGGPSSTTTSLTNGSGLAASGNGSSNSAPVSPAISSIFPPISAIPGSREELINRIRERVSVGGNFLPPSGLELASLFPNIAKLNPAAVFGLPLHSAGLKDMASNMAAAAAAAAAAASAASNGKSSGNGLLGTDKNNSVADLQGHVTSAASSKLPNGHLQAAAAESDDEQIEDGMMADVEYGDESDEMMDNDHLSQSHHGTGSAGTASPQQSSSRRASSATTILEDVKPSLDELRALAQCPASSSSSSNSALTLDPRNSEPLSYPYHRPRNSPGGVEIDVGGGGAQQTAAKSIPSPSPIGRYPGQHQQQQYCVTPVLQSAINSSPLNSLMYHKKLSNALRNKRPAAAMSGAESGSSSASGHHPSPYMNHQKYSSPMASIFNIYASQQSQQSPLDFASHLHSTPHPHPQPPAYNNHRQMSRNDDSPERGERKSSKTIHIPSTNGVGGVPGSHQNSQNMHLSDDSSHISPTDSASTKSTSSTATEPKYHQSYSNNNNGQVTSNQSPPNVSHPNSLPVAHSFNSSAHIGAPGTPSTTSGQPCFQCQVLKGKLAQAENRCRFLESRTTSQESKISRLENRVQTLEANNRRYETEAVSLRDHCEILERKILECQERSLKYLSNNEFDPETTKKILHDVLETCRVYKQN